MLGNVARRISEWLSLAATDRRPLALAHAVAWGIALGGMPKANLMAVALAGSWLFLRMNYLVAAVCLIASGWLAGWNDSWPDALGRGLLEMPSLQPVWNHIATWPVFPWLHWNNSLVMGNLALGSGLFLPTYAACACLQRRPRPQGCITLRMEPPTLSPRSQPVSDPGLKVDALSMPISTSDKTNPAPLPIAAIPKTTPPATLANSPVAASPVAPPRAGVMPATTFVTPAVASMPELRVSKAHWPEGYRLDTSSAEALVKPMAIEERQESRAKAMAITAPSREAAILQETIIEIVRYRPKDTGGNTHSSKQASSFKRSGEKHQESLSSQARSVPMIRSATESKKTAIEQDSPPAGAVTASELERLTASTETSEDRPREEALRYLLWHLSSVKQHPSLLRERSP